MIAFFDIIISILFFSSVFSIEVIPYFKYISLIVIGVYVAFNNQYFFRRKYRLLNTIFIAFCVVVLITAYINRGNVVTRDPFKAAIVWCGQNLENLLLFEIVSEKKQGKRAIDVLTFWSVVAALLSDFIYIYNSYTGHLLFDVGNKFSVAYLNFFMLLLVSTKYKIHKYLNCFIFGFVILVNVIIHSSTGIVLVGLYVLFTILRKYNNLFRTSFLYFDLLFAGLFPFVYSFILNNSISRFIVEDFLKRDITLTNRTVIYSLVIPLLSEKILSGYGYGTSYEIGQGIAMTFPNTQNAILEWVWQGGIIAAVLLVVFVVLSYKKSYFVKCDSYVEGFGAAILAYIFIGSVEIVFSTLFLLILFMLTGWIYETKESDDNNNYSPFGNR